MSRHKREKIKSKHLGNDVKNLARNRSLIYKQPCQDLGQCNSSFASYSKKNIPSKFVEFVFHLMQLKTEKDWDFFYFEIRFRRDMKTGNCAAVLFLGKD